MLVTAAFEKCLATVRPETPAIIDADEGVCISYGEMWEQVCHFSIMLKRIGVRSGDRVILALPNSIAWAVSYFAILKAGAVAVPVRPTAGSCEMRRILAVVKPSLMLTASSFINRVLPLKGMDGTEPVAIASRELMRSGGGARITTIQSLMAGPVQEYSEQSSTSDAVDGQQIVSILFTYRGLGRPLGAMLSHDNYLAAINSYVMTVGLREGQRVLAALPFAHVYPLVGCLLAPLFSRATIVVTKQISGEGLLEVIERFQCNVLTGVPTLYHQLAHVSTEHRLSWVESAICGASLLSLKTFEAFRERYRVEIRQGYGLTECFAVTCNPAKGNKPQSLGKLMVGAEGLEVSVIDEFGHRALPDQIGEIIVRGPTVMSGYWGEPNFSNEVLRNGWLHTGDLGRMDTNGYVFFAGLKKRITKVAGNMVDLCEVEAEIRRISGAKEVEVYPVADERLGSILCAKIGNGGILSGDEKKNIRSHLKRRVASYKVPMLWRNGQDSVVSRGDMNHADEIDRMSRHQAG